VFWRQSLRWIGLHPTCPTGLRPSVPTEYCQVPHQLSAAFRKALYWAWSFSSQILTMSCRFFHKHQVSYHLYAEDKEADVSVPVNNVMCHWHVMYFSVASVKRQSCHQDIGSWCVPRRLQPLNAANIELIWFGSRQMLEKLMDSDLTLDTAGTTRHPTSKIRS